jgi:hypothetical protein
LLVLAALVLAGALALAAPAVAADSPTELDVWDYQANVGQAADVELDLFVAAASAPTAKATIYVPVGFGVNTSAAPGTEIGDAFATLLSGSASLKGTGKVVVDNPANYLAQTCAPGAHAAVWVLKVSAGGQEVDVPVYVDPAAPDVAGFASFTLQACFTAPVGPTGLRLGELDVDLSSGITNPTATASHLWRVLLTPFGADGTPSLSGTTELQAIVPLPQHLTVAARYVRKSHRVVLSGTVIAAGHPRAGVNVHFLSSPTPSFAKIKTFGTAKTNGSGHFTFRHRLTATTYFVAYMNPYYATGCSPTIGTAPCTTATISPPPASFARAIVKH